MALVIDKIKAETITRYVCQHCGFTEATHIVKGSSVIPHGAAYPGEQYHPSGEWDSGPDDIKAGYQIALCDFCYKKTEPLMEMANLPGFWRLFLVMRSRGLIELPQWCKDRISKAGG